MFVRFVSHLTGLLGAEEPQENNVLEKGFF